MISKTRHPVIPTSRDFVIPSSRHLVISSSRHPALRERRFSIAATIGTIGTIGNGGNHWQKISAMGNPQEMVAFDISIFNF